MPAITAPFLDSAVASYLDAPGLPRVDFARPVGAPALFAHDSVTWRVFKNPIALLVGGIAAVILELAEPRVRSGVWEHTSFRTDPVTRMKRTGHAAMVTVYAPADTARAMIEGVSRRHARVVGETPAGVRYRADDPVLLDWVQATASFCFLEAYRRYAHGLSAAECDRFYAEGAAASALYGATGAPRSTLEMDATFARMRPALERSDIIADYLGILRRAPFLPAMAAPLKPLVIAAAIAITPSWARDLLGIRTQMPLGGETLLRTMGAAGERLVLRAAPPAQASTRLGLGADYLYR